MSKNFVEFWNPFAFIAKRFILYNVVIVAYRSFYDVLQRVNFTC